MGLKSPDLDSQIERMLNLPNDVRNNVDNQMRRAGKAIQTQQELLIPVNKYSGGGDLKRAQRSGVKTTDKSTILSFWNKEPYAGYVEFGTGAIGALNPATDIPEGLALSYSSEGWVYFNEETQEFYFTYGMPARQFFYPPIFNNIKMLESTWKKALKGAIKENAKRSE